MRVVFGLVLVIGLALAGFAVKMTRGYISAYQAHLAEAQANQGAAFATSPVYVVTELMEYGEPLLPENVKLVQYPADAVPTGVFDSEEMLFPEGEERPRIVLRTMDPLEAILTSKVTGPGEDAGVSSRLGKGMRAFAIEVDVSSGVSGFLRPGDRVDVYWTGRLPGTGYQGESTKLIEASVSIVAVDQMADAERSSPTVARTITVEVTPQQVAALATAQSSGRLSLSLVGNNDDTISAGVEVDQKTLLGIKDTEVVEAAPERVCSIKTRKGAEVVVTPIPCN